MKTKITIAIIAFLCIILIISMTGCKKSKSTTSTNSDNTSQEQLTTDANNVRGASFGAMFDVNSILSQVTDKSTGSLPCNIVLDSSTVSSDTITYTITFNGPNCEGTSSRSGQVLIKKNITKPWKDAGSTVIVTYRNFKVIWTFTTDTIILNGQETFENVSGGRLSQLGNGITSIFHRDWGAINVTFSSNITVQWNISRQMEYLGTISQLILRTTGFGTQSGYTNLADWGTSRNNEIFYDQFPGYVEHWEQCYWHPVSGINTIWIPSVLGKVTSTYGYDDNHQPISGNTCPTAFKVDWLLEGNSGTFYIQLYP
jgi:hypothetical protein